MTSWGINLEEAARADASNYGVPDFVYNPVEISKGGATREVSDGLLIARSRGIIIQSKARTPGKADSDTRIRSWLDKQIESAAKQVTGTRSTLGRGALDLVSRRGLPLVLDEPLSSAWPGVILVDSGDTPVPHDYFPKSLPPRCVVLTHRDWFALNERIRSSVGVINYVERILDAELAHPAVGDEQRRYFVLAEADANYVDREGGYPYFRLDPVAAKEEVFLGVLDEWIDKDISNPAVAGDPDAVRRAIEIIDAVPVTLRAELGRALMARIETSLTEKAVVSGVLAHTLSTDRILFMLGHEDLYETEQSWDDEVIDFAMVRHEELETIHGSGPSLVLARLATNGRAAKRTFAYLDGSSSAVSSKLRREVQHRRGVLLPNHRSVDPSTFRRNDPCPCDSGSKWKHCHMP